ncbi:hypothetical protein [Pseudaminobacter soli (ex Li et al. 2025)]|uniref:hypothetical protein n=1 Tax=Pseudaminobacter soli (ex Li et al. 2025) TaxID=1295366 RepID=UPI0015E6DFF2|nr:hypothetical protein [Mesorhizobium soli]
MGIHRTDAEKAAIGHQLLDKKAELPRGHFGAWLKEQGVPRQFASEAMRLARSDASLV